MINFHRIIAGLIIFANLTATSASAETAKEKLANDLAKFRADAAISGLAANLSMIVGSEDFCAITLDQDGIAQWIRVNVPPDRLDFAGQFQIMVIGQKGFNDVMSPSAKAAHCAVVLQSGKHFGLVK